MSHELEPEYSVDHYVFTPIAKTLAVWLHSYGVTPNAVTVANCVLRVGILCAIYRESVSRTSIVGLLILTYLLDCVDGTMARVYNETSEFGHKLDHVSDSLFWPLVLLLMWPSFRGDWTTKVFLILMWGVYGAPFLSCELCGAQCAVSRWLIANSMIPMLVVGYLYVKAGSKK